MNNKKNIIKIWVTMIAGLVLYLTIAFLVDTYIKKLFLINTIMIVATILFILFALLIFRSELKIVDFKCKNCKHLFKPKYKDVILAPHIGTTRYLKCPKCKEKNWNRIVLNK